MKKRHIKNLALNRNVISSLNALKGGARPDTSNTGTHLSADVKDCPDNTLALGCKSLGASGCDYC